MPGFYGVPGFIILPSAVRNTTQTLTRDQILAIWNAANGNVLGEAQGAFVDFVGIIAWLSVTAVPGTDGVLLALQEIEPVSGNKTTLATGTNLITTGLQRVRCARNITIAGTSTSGQSISDILPPNWQLQVVHSNSGGTNFTYSLAVALINPEVK